MPTERMEEVEVVCGGCNGVGGDTECCGRSGPECCGEPAVVRCGECLGEGRLTEFAPPGSLTAARLRLADAAEAWFKAPAVDDSLEWDAMERASFELALLRTARVA